MAYQIAERHYIAKGYRAPSHGWFYIQSIVGLEIKIESGDGNVAIYKTHQCCSSGREGWTWDL